MIFILFCIWPETWWWLCGVESVRVRHRNCVSHLKLNVMNKLPDVNISAQWLWILYCTTFCRLWPIKTGLLVLWPHFHLIIYFSHGLYSPRRVSWRSAEICVFLRIFLCFFLTEDHFIFHNIGNGYKRAKQILTFILHTKSTCSLLYRLAL